MLARSASMALVVLAVATAGGPARSEPERAGDEAPEGEAAERSSEEAEEAGSDEEAQGPGSDAEAEGPGSDAEAERRTVIRAPGRRTTPPVVVPRSELTEPGASPGEVLERQPGVHTEQLGGPASPTRVRIRGSTPEQVRVFLDGVELRNADGSPVDLSELPLWEAARLRVWRSHAPLGRGGAIGGALELVTRRGRTSFTEVAGEAAAFGTGRLAAHGAWAASGSADEAPGATGAAASVELMRSDGDFRWLDDRGTLYDPSDDRIRRRRNNDRRRVVGLVEAHTEAGPCRLELLDHGLALERGLPGPASSPASRARLARYTQLAALRTECRRGERWSVEALTALRWQRSDSSDPDGELFRAPTEAQRRALAPSARLTARTGLTPWLGLGVHGELAHERFELDDRERPSRDLERQRTSGALAVELPLHLERASLDLVPRLRVDAFQDAGGTGRVEPTWQLAAAWSGLADHGLRLRGAVGSGVRQPDLFELYGDGARVLPNPELDPEESVTGSVSGRWAVPGLPRGWLLELGLAGWASRTDELIQLRRASPWTAVAENVQAARMAGLEGTLRADLFGHLRLRWMHAQLWTATVSPEPARDGERLPLRPASSDHARVEGYLGRPDGSEISAHVDLDHLGSNTYDRAGLVEAPARWIVSTGLGMRWRTDGLFGPSGRFQAGVEVRNVGDRSTVDLLGHPRPGRSWALRIAWRESLP